MAVDLSVVLPVFNECAGLSLALDRIRSHLDALELSYEVICVDDGSSDGSTELLRQISDDDSRVVLIEFTRNFGKEAALEAGALRARGDATIFIDADLQHPPELISEMVRLWRDEGFEVVEARRRSRQNEHVVYRACARVFDALIGGATHGSLNGATDFKLLSRSALDTLCSFPEQHRFFRGLVRWIGFESATLDFDALPRTHGTSGWSALRLTTYALHAVVSFTTLPLIWIAAIGLFTTGVGALLGIIALSDYLRGQASDGFTTVILLLVVFSGLILTSLGTLSLYVGRLFDEIKRRPHYIVRSRDKERLEPPPSATSAKARTGRMRGDT